MKTAYRIYRAPDGCTPSFCGERETLREAEAFAATEPAGLEQSLWDTARAAGHCGGMRAPDGGIEDVEPISWHGANGYHCVVRVRYEEFSCPACGGEHWGTVDLDAGTVECHADGCGWTGQRSECGL